MEATGSERVTWFAELLLPVPIPRTFTYRVPVAMNGLLQKGQRCIVPFGQRKILTGVVIDLHQQPPSGYEAKMLLEVLDAAPVMTEVQLSLVQWMASYYLCTQGEVLQAALPAGLKLSSESMVQLHPAFQPDESDYPYSEKEWMVIRQLQHEPMSYADIAKLLEVKSIYSILKSLTIKEAVILYESVREKYKPLTEKRVRLTEVYTRKEKLEALFEELASKPKQEAVLLRYLQDVPVFQDVALNEKGISKHLLVEGDLSASSLQTLVRNQVLEEFETVIPRFGFDDHALQPPQLLSEAQSAARQSILKSFEAHGTALLHGVTGSGKTEIYIDLIRQALEGGSQVLYLLPEIALTTQVVTRLKKVFGSQMGVYHSKYSDNERVEVWNGVMHGKLKFVVGVRSSVFLPFDNLGLIIVDEEHDPSYKQHEPAPRYHARDTALMMGQLHHARVLLGTATPSCESWYLAQTGKTGLVQLSERFGEARLPEIAFADLSKERKQKTMKGEFSSTLLRSITEALKQGDQVIMFQNRRGYAPVVQCQDCSWVPQCINCAVSLTYHQFRHAMVCHYCGYREELPSKCPVCSSTRLLTLGYGTEKLEEEIKLHFPGAQVSRMDLDTTRNKNSYETILEEFESGRTNVLVGTQMVTKGLDFGKVNLVGIFDADRMMHFPDFRSHERAFQLVLQVSGRAGRREKAGHVVIQTSQPNHPVFQYVKNQQVEAFLNQELKDREEHEYPPFSRLIEFTVRHQDPTITQGASEWLAGAIRHQLRPLKLLGPTEPMIRKIRNEFLRTLLLKIPRQQGKLSEIKSKLTGIIVSLHDIKEYRNVRVVADVDPL